MKKYNSIFSTRVLWWVLIASTVASFSVLLYFGGAIYQQAPPMPTKVVSVNGEELFQNTDIQRGQNVWQSLGGMQRGSIWGHGIYFLDQLEFGNRAP